MQKKTLLMIATFLGLILGTFPTQLLNMTIASSLDDDNLIEWPMYHHDPAHTGYSNNTAPTTLPTQLWNYTLETDPESMPHSPAVADGSAYVISQGSLSCFDAATGTKIWNFPALNYAGTPAVVDGRVYVGSANGGVYSLQASSGLQVWNFSTGDSFDSSVTVVNDLVYAVSRYGKIYSPDSAIGGDIYCLDAVNGNIIWNFSIGYAASGASPAVSGNSVYVGNNDGNIFCLDAANGSEIWNSSTRGAVRSPAVADGYVYVGSADGNAYCFRASDGAKIWNYTTEYNSNGPAHNYDWGNAVSDPAVAYGCVYVGSSNFGVYCLDALHGSLIWNFTTGAQVIAAPAVADGYLLAGSYDGNLYCLNATSGSEIWRFPAGVFSPVNSAGTAGSPAVAEGVIYVVGNGIIYALAAPSTAPPFPLIYIALAAVVAVVVLVTAVYATIAKRIRSSLGRNQTDAVQSWGLL